MSLSQEERATLERIRRHSDAILVNFNKLQGLVRNVQGLDKSVKELLAQTQPDGQEEPST